MRIFNATLHDQDTPTQQAFTRSGLELVPDALGRGVVVPLEMDFAAIEQAAQAVVERAQAAGAHAILVGGLSSVAIALHAAAARAGLGVVEVRGERVRDEQGRFVFNYHGIREILPPVGKGGPWVQ